MLFRANARWWQSKAERRSPDSELPPFHELLRLKLQLQHRDRDCAAGTITTPTTPGEACCGKAPARGMRWE